MVGVGRTPLDRGERSGVGDVGFGDGADVFGGYGCNSDSRTCEGPELDFIGAAIWIEVDTTPTSPD